MRKLEGLEFKDVYIEPQYSELSSRKEIDISVTLGKDRFQNPLKLLAPVISANMDTITTSVMANAMWEAGGFGALHRFMKIEENVDEYVRVRGIRTSRDCFVSVGVNRDSKERSQALYNEGARYFIIDIAHGHSKMMGEMMEWMKGNLPDIFLMAGNVATFLGASQLASWGADAIKVGIGPGAVCLTKNVTGVTVPQLGAIEACTEAMDSISRKVLIVADGGIKEYGDVAKAIAAGADMVMVGSLLAGTTESSGDIVNGKKVYRGMASKDAMRFLHLDQSMPTPEGTSVLVDSKGPVREVIDGIAGGLRSAFSYSNSKNMSEFHARVKLKARLR